MDKERQIYQLHQKGYEDIAKAISEKPSISISIEAEDAEKIEVESPKGDNGQDGVNGKDGKTPVKGLDYFTSDEVEQITKDILKEIPKPKDGINGKDAIVDYERINKFVKQEVAKIPKPKDGIDGFTPKIDYESITKTVLEKIPAVDYPTIYEYVSKQVERIEATRARPLNSGGPTTRLGEISDVDMTGITNGQVLAWNGTNWLPITPSGGGGGAVDSVNGQTGVVVLTTNDVAEVSDKKYLTNAEETKLGNITVTQAVNLDTIESDTATNNAKVTNATHTGDAEGATALTVKRINGVALSGLATGILKNTTTTGVPSIAVAGDFPTLNQNTTGSAATLTTGRTIGTATGDVTSAGSSFNGSANNTNAYTIATAVVTNAKLANMATKTYKGRTTAGTGVPEDVSVATLKTDLVLVKADVGLANVDNTSDVNKPISTATQTALDLKQPIVRSTRMGWVFPDNTINGATDILANKWHTISAMWYELTTAGDFLKRDTSAYGSNFYFTTANALIVRQNSTVALVNISSANATYVNALTASSAKRAALIAEMILFCKTNNFDGVDLDMETFQTGSMSAAQWIDFKTMLQEMGDALHAQGLMLSVEVPPIWNTAANTESGTGDAWDSANSQGYYRLVYSELNNLPVDQVVIMAYDYQYDYSAGQPNQPLAWLKDILNFARNNFNEDRINIVAGLPSAGYSGATGGYSITGRTYSYLSVQTGFGGASRDASSGELIWANAGTSYAAIDDAAIVLKVQQCENMGIYQYALWHIGNNKYGATTQTIIAPEKKKFNTTTGYLHIQDQKAANTAGGSSVAATWNTRTLNTVVRNTITGASLASNQVTLPAGTYSIRGRCPAFIVSKHKSRLRNTTDGTTTLIGSSSYTDGADAVQNDTTVMGQFTITGTKVFELQHYTELTRATNGFGVATNATELEVYSEIEITRLM